MSFNRGFLTKPAVKAELARWPDHRLAVAIASEKADVAIVAAGPRDCCADFARVIDCENGVDVWECIFCGYAWSAPCR